MNQNTPLRISTQCLHAGQQDDPTTHARAVPIYATAAYNFTSTEHAANLFGLKEFGNIYSRLMNPTNDVLEKRLAALDGGAAGLALRLRARRPSPRPSSPSSAPGRTSSPPPACTAGPGRCSRRRSTGWASRCGSSTPTIRRVFANSPTPSTRCVYLESHGQPQERRARLGPYHRGRPRTGPAGDRGQHGDDAGAAAAHRARRGHRGLLHAPSTSAATACTSAGPSSTAAKFPWAKDPQRWPEFCPPDPSLSRHGLHRGASAGGQHRLHPAHAARTGLRDTGACMSPFAAFLFLLGLETLHAADAAALRQRPGSWPSGSAKHPTVAWVNYPGPAPASLPRPGQEVPARRGRGRSSASASRAARPPGMKFINTVKLASHLANIGDAKTLVIHPA